MLAEAGELVQPLHSVTGRCEVVTRPLPLPLQPQWRQQGGKEPPPEGPDEEKEEVPGQRDRYWCQFHYDSRLARFERPRVRPQCSGGEGERLSYCWCCELKREEEERWSPSTGEKDSNQQ